MPTNLRSDTRFDNYQADIWRQQFINWNYENHFSNYQLNAQFLYSSTICILHYDPQHVSSSILLVLRRTNCITTASGIVILCKRLYSMPVESGLVRLFTESDNTRGCGNTICPPEDEQGAAWNVLWIVM